MNTSNTPLKNVSTENMVRWGIIALVAMVALITAVIVGPKLVQGLGSTKDAAANAGSGIKAASDAVIAGKIAKTSIEKDFPGIELTSFEESTRDGAEDLLREVIGVEQFADNAVNEINKAQGMGECHYFTFSGSSPKGETTGVKIVIKKPNGEWQIYPAR